MKKEDLMVSFNQIKPSESTKKRMLNNIMNHSGRKKGIVMKLFYFKKAIPALVLTIVIAGGLLTYNMLAGKFNSSRDYGVTDNAGQGQEDLAAPIINQFQIDDKHYILLSDELREDYGLPAMIDKGDIGKKITNITNGPDKNLIGSEVYNYIPAGGEAVVAVKKDNDYQLFRFFTFESYNNNQDVDSVEYLALYGIDNANDIAKIQFIFHSEQSKMQGITDIREEITDRDEIERFYSFYSVLKNSSDKYFDRLFNYDANSGYQGVESDAAAPEKAVLSDEIESHMTAPDHIGYGNDLPMDVTPGHGDVVEEPSTTIVDKIEAEDISGDTPASSDNTSTNRHYNGMIDMGDNGAKSIEGVQGSAGNALANPIAIRIYNRNGIYYDSVYYKNIGFISRYEVSEEFDDFIRKYIDK